MLATVRIIMFDNQGQPRMCTAFLDSDSQSSYISTDLYNLLKLTKKQVDLPVSGIGQISVRFSSFPDATTKSRVNGYREDVQCIVTERTTEMLLTQRIGRNFLLIPEDLTLADPGIHVPGQIDMILDTTVFWNLLCIGQIKLGKNLSIL